MRNATLPVVVGGVSVILLIIVILFTGSKDETGPSIEFTNDCVTVFSDEDDAEILLQGVKAIDKNDGDVTNTLRIQNITVLSAEKKLVIHYSAKDNDNNIGQAERTIDYTGTKDYINFSVLNEEIFSDLNETGSSNNQEPSSNNDETSSSGANVNEESSSNEENSNDETSSSTEETSSNEEDTNSPDTNEETETIDRAAVDASGIPQIKMKYHELKVSVGSDFYFMDALADWYDDKDDVSRRVIILGEYDINVPGTYELTYYVTDTDLNVSNKEKLTLIVE